MVTISLEGKTILITGASGQLGRVMARTAAECGADVILHYHGNEAKANSLKEEIENREYKNSDGEIVHRKAFVVQADITKEESVAKMAETIAAEFKMPDIIVNNAVIQYEWKSVIEQDVSDYYSQFESCVMHNVYMVKGFAPYMKEKGWGRIIAINSECAYMGERGCSAYTSAKRGVDGVVRVLAKELGEFGITVNQVAPGWTETERDRENNVKANKEYIDSVPLGRRGTDQEIANMVVFLASDLASFTTGAYIPVSGGRVMPGI